MHNCIGGHKPFEIGRQDERSLLWTVDCGCVLCTLWIPSGWSDCFMALKSVAVDCMLGDCGHVYFVTFPGIEDRPACLHLVSIIFPGSPAPTPNEESKNKRWDGEDVTRKSYYQLLIRNVVVPRSAFLRGALRDDYDDDRDPLLPLPSASELSSKNATGGFVWAAEFVCLISIYLLF